jgi:conjugative transfer region lipoprotein (TIGR03751 family)
MVLNNSHLERTGAVLAVALASWLSGCTAMAPRESPLNQVTQQSPTALEIYRGRTAAASDAAKVRNALETETRARAVTADDTRTSPYWSALEPMRQRFSRVPNPDLVMVVYPHLAKGKYPVPGYVTTFPMYDEVIYALPGEMEQGSLEARARYVPPAPPAPATKPVVNKAGEGAF